MSEGTYRLLSPLMTGHANKVVDMCLEHGHEQTAELLKNLRGKSAARLLEQLPSWFGGIALGHLDDVLAAELLNMLEANTSARLLRFLDKDRGQVVLDMLDPRHAKKVASFAAVDESKVGSVVRSVAMSVRQGASVATALDLVRRHPDKVMDYLYVIGPGLELTGVLPMKRLLLGDAAQRIDSLATSNPDFLRIDDSLAQAAAHPRWNTAKVMPVVDRQGSFAGVIAETDLPVTRESMVALRDASQALAETFEVGLMGLLRLLFSGARGRQ
jgi:Mg/Co/Ni transporter MgtE